MKKKEYLYALIAGLSVIFSACGGEDEPDKGGTDTTTNSLTYLFTKSNIWSSIAYKDVTLVEIHSDIEDFSLQCSGPKGYDVRLDKESTKDGAGFTVYRIVCDMSAITEVTKENKNEMITLNYKLTGNGFKDGKKQKYTYENKCTLQRYCQPEDRPEALYKNWYLTEYTTDSNYYWANFESRTEYTETQQNQMAFTISNTPLSLSGKINAEYDQNGNKINNYILDSSCNIALAGWVKGMYVPMNDRLKESLFGFESESSDYGCSVFFINENVMWCMKATYNESGSLIKTSRYKFEKKADNTGK